MAEEDVFRRAFEMGSAFFALTQKRAESMLADLADSGESARDQAQKVVDDAVEKGRQRTGELVDLVRSEIRAQVAALGLATKDDIDRLEAKLEAAATGAPWSGAAAVPPEPSPSPSPSAGGGAGAEPATDFEAGQRQRQPVAATSPTRTSPTRKTVSPKRAMPASSKSAGAKPAGPKPKPAGAKPAEPKPAGAKSAAAKSAGAKPKPAGPKPAGPKAAGAKPAGAKPAGGKPASPESPAAKSAGPESPGLGPDDSAGKAVPGGGGGRVRRRPPGAMPGDGARSERA